MAGFHVNSTWITSWKINWICSRSDEMSSTNPGRSDWSVSERLNGADRSRKTRRWLWRVVSDDSAEVGRELVARPPLIVQLTAATAPACSARWSRRRLMHHQRRLGAVYHSSDESTHHRRIVHRRNTCHTYTSPVVLIRVTSLSRLERFMCTYSVCYNYYLSTVVNVA